MLRILISCVVLLVFSLNAVAKSPQSEGTESKGVTDKSFPKENTTEDADENAEENEEGAGTKDDPNKVRFGRDRDLPDGRRPIAVTDDEGPGEEFHMELDIPEDEPLFKEVLICLPSRTRNARSRNMFVENYMIGPNGETIVTIVTRDRFIEPEDYPRNYVTVPHGYEVSIARYLPDGGLSPDPVVPIDTD